MLVDLHDVEEALRRGPTWHPPPDFVHGAVRRASTAFHEWPEPEGWFSGNVVLAAASGLAAACLVYVIGVFLVSGVSTLVQQSAGTFPGYTMFVEVSSRVLAARAVHLSWVSAGLSLALAHALVQRARA